MKLFFLIMSMLWQTPAPVNGTLTGTVVVAGTAEPIADAQIAVLAAGSLLETTTDASGRFSLANVPAGRQTVIVRADGFFATPAAANAVPQPRVEVPANVAQGTSASLPPVTMIRGAIITGKVLDIQGRPLPAANVRALRQGLGDQLQPVATRLTDDQGEYRLFWIPPGEYVIGVSPRPPLPSNLAAQPPQGGPPRMVTTLFPGTTEISQASKVAVKSGDEIRGINISARLDMLNPPPSAVTTFKVSGQIINALAPGGSGPGQLMLASRGQLRGLSSLAVDAATVPFEIPAVPPGSHELFLSMRALRGSPDPIYGPTAWGHITFEVRDRNIDDLKITIHPSIDVSGVLKVDGKAAPSGGSLKIGLSPLGIAAAIQNYRDIANRTQTPGAEGKFSIPAAAEGNYDVFVQGAPANAYLADIRQNDKSILASGIEVHDTAPVPFEVLLGTDGGTVDGLATNSDRSPAPASTVILVPTDAQLLKLSKIVRADAEGKYSIRSVRPGEYKLFAVPISVNAVNPDLVSRFDAKSVKVTVKPAGTTRTDVVVITD